MTQLTPCACPTPGRCPRHHLDKTPRWHELCQTSPAYFALWEQRRGPGQASPAPSSTDALANPLPCRHRGPVIGQVPCQLCGGRTILHDLYACTLHETCTLSRTTRLPHPHCLTCADRRE